MQRSIPGIGLQLNDLVIARGAYTRRGLVVHLSPQYTLLLNHEGHLYRVRRRTDGFILIGRHDHRGWWGTDAAQSDYTAITDALGRRGVQEAITRASVTPLDPAGVDEWLLPLFQVAGDERLTPVMARYYGWDAYTRRRFETTISMLGGDRQREVFLRCVLGHDSAKQLRDDYGLGDAAIRTARWRAWGLIRRFMPHTFDQEGERDGTEPTS